MEEITKEEIEELYSKYEIEVKSFDLNEISVMHNRQIENLLNDFSINNQVYTPLNDNQK